MLALRVLAASVTLHTGADSMTSSSPGRNGEMGAKLVIEGEFITTKLISPEEGSSDGWKPCSCTAHCGTCARSANSRFTCAECPECSEHGGPCPRSTDHDGCVCPRGSEHDAAGRPVRVHLCVRVSLIIVSCLTVISVLLTVVCFTMLMQLQRSQRRTHHHHANASSLCLPCGSLRLSTGEENALLAGMKRHVDPSTGRYECCSNSRVDAGQMLNRVVEKKIRLEKAKGTFINGMTSEYPQKIRTYAHLLGMKQPAHPNSNVEPAVRWLYNKGMGRTENIQYDNGYLVIPKKGLYFVYSQLYLVDYPSDGVTNKTIKTTRRFTHKVVRTNILYKQMREKPILQNTQSKCWTRRRGFWEMTSYVGAVLYLRREDRLAVKVSNTSLIHHNPKASYFGIINM